MRRVMFLGQKSGESAAIRTGESTGTSRGMMYRYTKLKTMTMNSPRMMSFCFAVMKAPEGCGGCGPERSGRFVGSYFTMPMATPTLRKMSFCSTTNFLEDSGSISMGTQPMSPIMRR